MKYTLLATRITIIAMKDAEKTGGGLKCSQELVEVWAQDEEKLVDGRIRNL